MRKALGILMLGILFNLNLSAQGHMAGSPFSLVSSDKKSVSQTDLADLEKDQTAGRKEGTNLHFAENEIRLLALTGPEDDMLSFLIQGMRNPTLVIPSGATMRILFVNVDADMPHDLRFGHMMKDFPVEPGTSGTAGSTRLKPKTEGSEFQAEEITVKADQDGHHAYFCWCAAMQKAECGAISPLGSSPIRA